MGLQQERDERQVTSAIRLLNQTDVGFHQQTASPETRDQIPEHIRKFLEGFFADRSGSIF